MKSVPLEIPRRTRLPIERINRQSDESGTAVTRLRLDLPVDHTRLFTPPGLAPLTHAPIFAELTVAQQRRYNQLAGLMHNEIICFFEQELAAYVLPALLRPSTGIAEEFASSLRQFLKEEKQHTQMFRQLNHMAESNWYRATDYYILRLPKSFLFLLRQITSRPILLPMVFWIMLLMEERSLLISKRYAVEPESIDPRFLETYRAHAEDEGRHVQLDWHLLEHFYQGRPGWHRKLNARLLEAAIIGLLLKPRRANVRLVELLVVEFPELEPMRRRLVEAVHDLVNNDGYRHMMYSPEATPISRALFEKLPEFKRLRRRLFAE